MSTIKTLIKFNLILTQPKLLWSDLRLNGETDLFEQYQQQAEMSAPETDDILLLNQVCFDLIDINSAENTNTILIN